MCKVEKSGGVRAPLLTDKASHHALITEEKVVTGFAMQKFNKSSAALVVVIICISIGCSRGQYPPSKKDDGGVQPLVNQTCSPPFGFLRNLCGPEIVINETIERTPLYLYG